MEPVVATGGNRSQIELTDNQLRRAKTVAVGCDRLPETFHGKEGRGSPVRVRKRALKKRCKSTLVAARITCICSNLTGYGALSGTPRHGGPCALPREALYGGPREE
jgi:hypothetical protein